MTNSSTDRGPCGQSAAEGYRTIAYYGIVLGLAALVAACTVDGSLGKSESTQAGSGAGTGDVSDGDDGAGGSDGDDGGASGSGGGGTGGDDGSGGDGSTGDRPPEHDECNDQPTDSPCRMCLKGHCCPELAMCRLNDTCSCYMDCVDAGTDAADCRHDCGAETDQDTDLGRCQHEQCADACG